MNVGIPAQRPQRVRKVGIVGRILQRLLVGANGEIDVAFVEGDLTQELGGVGQTRVQLERSRQARHRVLLIPSLVRGDS